jgi:hypothetical protein
MLNKMKYIIFATIVLVSYGFLYSQDTLEEIVTWEIGDENVQFRCQNPNSDGSDLNNDGYDDFIRWYYGDPYSFQFFMGSETPNTTYDFEIEVPFGSGYISWGGDLNDDGYQDIVFSKCTDFSDPGDVYICLGGDDINLEPELILQGEDYVGDYYDLGYRGFNGGYDFNGDGYDDFMLNGNGILWGNHYGEMNLDTTSLLYCNDIRDMNNDGYADVVSISLDPYTLDIFCGSQYFDDILEYSVPIYQSQYYYCHIGDFNHSGNNEFLVNNSDYSVTMYTLPAGGSNIGNSELPVNNYNLTNHPNPFTGETTISFSLTTNLHENTRIEIFNIKGQKVETLQITNSPNQQIIWNADNFASGVYFYKLVVDGIAVDTKKMILLK